MRDIRLQADRGKKDMGGRKLLPNSAVATLVEPVEDRFYFFSMARMMMGAGLSGGMLVVAALMACVMTRWMANVLVSMMLPTRLVL